MKALAFPKALTNDLWFLVQRRTSCPINYENVLETLPPITHILIFPFSISPFSAAVISSACFISHPRSSLNLIFWSDKEVQTAQNIYSQHLLVSFSGETQWHSDFKFHLHEPRWRGKQHERLILLTAPCFTFRQSQVEISIGLINILLDLNIWSCGFICLYVKCNFQINKRQKEVHSKKKKKNVFFL